jgi:DNA-binding transcriptional MerR regulator
MRGRRGPPAPRRRREAWEERPLENRSIIEPTGTAPNRPLKVFYKIREVSKLVGLPAYVLRYWETEFPTLHPKKSRGGQRLYEKKDIEMVLRIKHLLYTEGYTIAGAKRRLKQRRRGIPEVPPTLVSRIKGELSQILNLIKE